MNTDLASGMIWQDTEDLTICDHMALFPIFLASSWPPPAPGDEELVGNRCSSRVTDDWRGWVNCSHSVAPGRCFAAPVVTLLPHCPNLWFRKHTRYDPSPHFAKEVKMLRSQVHG